MTHRNVSEPDVTLLVTLLRAVPFVLVSLGKYGTCCGSSIRGPEVDPLRFVGLTTPTAAGRYESRMDSVDIIKRRS